MISRPFRHYIYIALAVIALTLLSSFRYTAQAEGTVPPKIAGTFIQDHSGVLTPEQKTQLAARVAQFKQSYDTEIGLATVPTLSGYGSANELITQMARTYGIGSKEGEHRGVLILIVTTDRKYALTGSRHTQGELTDGRLGVIGRQMIPDMKNADWAGAFNRALAGLEPHLQALGNTQTSGATAPVVAPQGEGIGLFILIFLVILFSIGFAIVVRFFLRRRDDFVWHKDKVKQSNNTVRGRTVSGDMAGRRHYGRASGPETRSYKRRTESSDYVSDYVPTEPVFYSPPATTYTAPSQDTTVDFGGSADYDGGGADGTF